MDKLTYKAHVRAYRLARNTAFAAMLTDPDNREKYAKELIRINQEFDAKRYIVTGCDKYDPHLGALWAIRTATSKMNLSRDRAFLLADKLAAVRTNDLPYPIEPAPHVKNFSFYQLLLNNLNY